MKTPLVIIDFPDITFFVVALKIALLLYNTITLY